MSGTVKRIYAGSQPTTFMAIGHVEPGDVIDVPAELCAGFDRRSDITVPAGEYDAETAKALAAGAALDAADPWQAEAGSAP